jgi:hypothetical protein
MVHDTLSRLEPLPVTVDEGHRRNRHAKDIAGRAASHLAASSAAASSGVSSVGLCFVAVNIEKA